MGRHSEYNQEIAKIICNRLICGIDDKPESLRSICRDDAMPGLSTVMTWLNKVPEFQEQYARARELQQELNHEEIMEIADNSTDDIYYLTSEGDGEKASINHSAIARAKLQIDTRKWIMGKMSPKKYGDKGNDVTINLNLSSRLEKAKRLKELNSAPSIENNYSDG